MTLLLTADQRAMQDTVRRLLADRSPSSRVRELMESGGSDEELWTTMVGEVGLAGVAIPERFGGDGLGWTELSLVFEELGRSLARVPFVATTVASGILLSSEDDSACAEHLPRIARGEAVATAVLGPAVRADATGGGRWTLTGSAAAVLDGDVADLLVVVAHDEEGAVGLFLVDGEAAGLSRRPRASLDPTRRYSGVELAAVGAQRLETPDPAAALTRALDLARLALGAEQVGGLEQCVRSAVDHAATRVQFGRRIGSFQAIKHRCADLYLDWELAYSVLRHATRVADARSEELGLAVALLHDVASDAAVRAATENIQIHGGMGYAWESDAHLYYKRALASQSMFDSRQQARADFGRRLALAPTG